MPYRKFQADYLFTGKGMMNNTSVLISDEAGKIVDIVDQQNAGENVEMFSGMISPGFVNTHCHLELSHLKAKIPEKTGLFNFVYRVVTERHYPPEEIMESMEKALVEMTENGVSAVGDICNNDLALGVKDNGGIRYYNFVEVSGWNPFVAVERFSRSKLFYDKYLESGQKTSMVPHAPYSVSQSLWEKITPYFSGKIVTIHNQETPAEDEFFFKGTGDLLKMYEMMKNDNSFYTFPGTSSLQSYFEKLSAASSVILVHNTFITQTDIDFIFKKKPKNQLVSFCLCPNANIYIENSLPPVEILMSNEVNLVIGTDSLASNHQLNILEELKTILKNFPAIKTEVMLTWATINGARALQMEDQIGSFEKGKLPGIILLENMKAGEITQDSKARRIL